MGVFIGEHFAERVFATQTYTQWIEPFWKMLHSNKGILPILWELLWRQRNLLECYFDETKKNDRVRQETAVNVGRRYSVDPARRDGRGDRGPLGGEGVVCHAAARIVICDGAFPVTVSRMNGGVTTGIGVRPSKSPMPDNSSSFVPHLFE